MLFFDYGGARFVVKMLLEGMALIGPSREIRMLSTQALLYSLTKFINKEARQKHPLNDLK